MMATVDIGPGVADRASFFTYGFTRVDLANPANATGILNVMQIWFATNGSGVKCGTFSGSSTDYDDRDYETIGNVTAGGQNFSGLNCTVVTGDFLGAYWSGGTLEAAATGGSGVYALWDDQFGKGSQTYGIAANHICSIYATGPAGAEYSAAATVAVGFSPTATRTCTLTMPSSAIAIGFFIMAYASKNTFIASALVKLGLTASGSAGKRAFGYVLKRYAKFASKSKSVRFIE